MKVIEVHIEETPGRFSKAPGWFNLDTKKGWWLCDELTEDSGWMFEQLSRAVVGQPLWYEHSERRDLVVKEINIFDTDDLVAFKKAVDDAEEMAKIPEKPKVDLDIYVRRAERAAQVMGIGTLETFASNLKYLHENPTTYTGEPFVTMYGGKYSIKNLPDGKTEIGIFLTVPAKES